MKLSHSMLIFINKHHRLQIKERPVDKRALEVLKLTLRQYIRRFNVSKFIIRGLLRWKKYIKTVCGVLHFVKHCSSIVSQ